MTDLLWEGLWRVTVFIVWSWLMWAGGAGFTRASFAQDQLNLFVGRDAAVVNEAVLQDDCEHEAVEQVRP